MAFNKSKTEVTATSVQETNQNTQEVKKERFLISTREDTLGNTKDRFAYNTKDRFAYNNNNFFFLNHRFVIEML